MALVNFDSMPVKITCSISSRTYWSKLGEAWKKLVNKVVAGIDRKKFEWSDLILFLENTFQLTNNLKIITFNLTQSCSSTSNLTIL